MSNLGSKDALSPPESNWAVGGSLILFILSALLLLGVQGITLYDRFARASEVGLDNHVWIFSQLEVEAKNFTIALLEGMTTEGEGNYGNAKDSLIFRCGPKNAGRATNAGPGKGATNAAVAKLLTEIKTEVETGSSLAAAFRKYPLYFDNLYCNLVEAGEAQASSRASMRSRYCSPSRMTRCRLSHRPASPGSWA